MTTDNQTATSAPETVKVLVETGSGAHSTSHARMQVKVVSGPRAGQYLYQCKDWQVAAKWDNHINNEKWVESVYNVPNGTQLQFTGSGATGARGVNKHNVDQIYTVDAAADVLDTTLDVGLRACTVRGRLRLERDLIKEAEAAKEIAMTEGF